MKPAKKDILGLQEMPVEDITQVLETAKTMKKLLGSGIKRTPHLQGKTIICLFYEDSTRTRLSFELASKYMSANQANVTSGGSSVSKGETLLDTARTIDMMAADVIVVRHPLSGAPHLLARHVAASVVNAGDGMHEHPTQGLLDMFTIMEKKGRIEGLRVAIAGDVLHSRVARSDIWGLQKMGASVCVAAPLTMMPKDIDKTGAEIFETIHEAITGADVVIGLRLQLERQKQGLFPNVREYSKYFGIDQNKLRLAKPDVLVMHPGPVNRGVEMTSEVIDAAYSAINEQVTNGLAVRMSILYNLTKR